MTQVSDQAAGTQQGHSYAADFRSGTAREPQRPQIPARPAGTHPGASGVASCAVWRQGNGQAPSEDGGPNGRGGRKHPHNQLHLRIAGGPGGRGAKAHRRQEGCQWRAPRRGQASGDLDGQDRPQDQQAGTSTWAPGGGDCLDGHPDRGQRRGAGRVAKRRPFPVAGGQGLVYLRGADGDLAVARARGLASAMIRAGQPLLNPGGKSAIADPQGPGRAASLPMLFDGRLCIP